jgi:4-amino-4-deoxychorismate lyase
MCQLFETIQVMDGNPQHLFYHERRMDAARRELFQCTDTIELASVILCPEKATHGRHKCKVVYGERIERLEFEPYRQRAITSLRIVTCDDIDYRYKYVDRRPFDRLLDGIDADDIIIVKNGLLTDTSFSNLAFLDGVRWITPASPLLEGTARARLIESGVLCAEEIRLSDMNRLSSAKLINALNDFGEAPMVPIEHIRW